MGWWLHRYRNQCGYAVGNKAPNDDEKWCRRPLPNDANPCLMPTTTTQQQRKTMIKGFTQTRQNDENNRHMPQTTIKRNTADSERWHIINNKWWWELSWPWQNYAKLCRIPSKKQTTAADVDEDTAMNEIIIGTCSACPRLEEAGGRGMLRFYVTDCPMVRLLNSLQSPDDLTTLEGGWYPPSVPTAAMCHVDITLRIPEGFVVWAE